MLNLKMFLQRLGTEENLFLIPFNGKKYLDWIWPSEKNILNIEDATGFLTLFI